MASETSVIICAYTEKRWDDLVAAVESVHLQASPAGEIIVVIDHNQQLYERVQQNLTGVIPIENRKTRGLSGARNSGIAAAKGKILAFLDDDAVAAADWLKTLEETFSDPEVLGAGGSIVPLWLVKKPAWLPEEFYWVVGCTYRGMPTTASKVRNVIGANMAFKQEVFSLMGGFRTEIGRVGTLPLGCEETELCIRAYQQWPDKCCIYQPGARVFHRVPSTRTTWRYFVARCYSEGISKAFVARFVGTNDGLSSERNYALYTLPAGVIRGLADGLFRRDFSGFARSWAILTGLTATVIGYAVGKFSFRRQSQLTQEDTIPSPFHSQTVSSS